MENNNYKIDKRGNWIPKEPIKPVPLFNFSRPIEIFKWIFGWPGYLFPWLTIYLAMAIFSYLYFYPSLTETINFNLSWTSQIFFKNLIIIFIVFGGFHTYLHTFEAQGDDYRYNVKKLQTNNNFWLFKNQTIENMFWTCVSGCSVWTIYEILFIWMYSNDMLNTVSFQSNPIYYCLLFFLIPIWQVSYFYFSHRLTHWKPLYKWVHYLHHKNVNTGPWSGLSMHPAEHIIYFGTCLIHFVIPSDPLHVVWHLMFNGLAAAAGHSGYNEISNKKDGESSLPHASYFHYLHHKYFECNYGELLFPFDKWFGTFHDGTKESGEKIFGSRKLKE